MPPFLECAQNKENHFSILKRLFIVVNSIKIHFE
jgi:hypothetical protein